MAVTNKTVLFFAEVPIISVDSENRVNHPHDPLFHMIYSNEMHIFNQFRTTVCFHTGYSSAHDFLNQLQFTK